jgi:hypothetical protein
VQPGPLQPGPLQPDRNLVAKAAATPTSDDDRMDRPEAAAAGESAHPVKPNDTHA